MNFQRVTLFVSLCLCMVLTLSATPAAAIDKDIAVVNIQQIMRDSSAAKSAREQLKAKQKAFQDELSTREKQLQKEDQELAKQRSVLAQDAFQQKVEEFRKKAADVQKDVREKRRNFSKAYDDAIGQLQSKVTGIIDQLAKERGFKLAVPTSQILYYDDALDISSEVLSRLNSEMPSLTVKF